MADRRARARAVTLLRSRGLRRACARRLRVHEPPRGSSLTHRGRPLPPPPLPPSLSRTAPCPQERTKEVDLDDGSKVIVIKHPRWPTYGITDEDEARPFSFKSGRFLVVHPYSDKDDTPSWVAARRAAAPRAAQQRRALRRARRVARSLTLLPLLAYPSFKFREKNGKNRHLYVDDFSATCRTDT